MSNTELAYVDIVLVATHKVSRRQGRLLCRQIKDEPELMRYINRILGKRHWGWYNALCVIPRTHPKLCQVVQRMRLQGKKAFVVDICRGRVEIIPYRHSDAERAMWLTANHAYGIEATWCPQPEEYNTMLDTDRFAPRLPRHRRG